MDSKNGLTWQISFNQGDYKTTINDMKADGLIDFEATAVRGFVIIGRTRAQKAFYITNVLQINSNLK